MYLINILISAIIIILGIIIGTQNGNTIVDVQVLGWSYENLSLSLVMLECILIGMVVIMLIAIVYEIRQRARYYKAQRRIKELEKELKEVRNLVADSVDNEVAAGNRDNEEAVNDEEIKDK